VPRATGVLPGWNVEAALTNVAREELRWCIGRMACDRRVRLLMNESTSAATYEPSQYA
jgi:hypothetical protein